MTEPSTDDERREANTALGTGVGIGAFGVASAALLGAVCPMCVVAAPALIGYGVYKRVQLRRAHAKAAAPAASSGNPSLAQLHNLPLSPEETP
jgi:hypothetical protein